MVTQGAVGSLICSACGWTMLALLKNWSSRASDMLKQRKTALWRPREQRGHDVNRLVLTTRCSTLLVFQRAEMACKTSIPLRNHSLAGGPIAVLAVVRLLCGRSTLLRRLPQREGAQRRKLVRQLRLNFCTKAMQDGRRFLAVALEELLVLLALASKPST